MLQNVSNQSYEYKWSQNEFECDGNKEVCPDFITNNFIKNCLGLLKDWICLS